MYICLSVCLYVPTLSGQTISKILVEFGTVLYKNLLNNHEFREYRLSSSCVLQVLVVHRGFAEDSVPQHVL